MVRNILNRNAINTICSTNIRGTRLDAMRLRRQLGVCCSVGTRDAHVAMVSDQSLTPHQPPVQEPRMQTSQPQEPGSQPQPGAISSPVHAALPVHTGGSAHAGRYGQPQGDFAAAVPFTECSRWAPLWAALVLSKSASPAATSVVAASLVSGKRSASS